MIMQFSKQQTKRLIEKFPSIRSYIENMTDPNPTRDPDDEIEDSITRYRIRFLNNMKTTTPHFAVRREYRRIYLSQPKYTDATLPPEVILETGHNRRCNMDLDHRKIVLLNRQGGYIPP